MAQFIAEYTPIIEFIEQGNKFPCDRKELENHPLIIQLQKEVQEEFNKDYICILGADQLQIITVNGPYRIEDYDGSESVHTTDTYEWFY